MAEHPRAQRKSSGPRSRWDDAFAAALPVIACFLGGATEKWAEGIILVLIGVVVLIDPPRFALGRAINVIAIALVACAFIAFLPAAWFSTPAWRLALTNDLGIELPTMLSPQPWATLQCLISFLGGLTWFYYVAGRDSETREVRYQLRFFTAGVIALAGLCLGLRFAHTTMPFWHNERNFGPFPNRNQTADLFAIGSVIALACAADDIRNKKNRWMLWVAGLGVLAGAIFINFSRAGIILLLAGAALWFGGLTLRKRSTARVGIALCALLALATVVLLFGGQTLERFHLRDGGMGVSTDFRWLIFQDALALIRASPWVGIGLGNFEPIFAVFREASSGDTRAHHPESDWLWLWSELGWLALLLTIAGAVLLLWRGFPRDEGRNYRFRLGAFVAALLFGLHGLFDVSGHRVGTAMSGLFLLGAAMPRPLQIRATFSPAVFRIVAVILIAAGATWSIAARSEHPIPGSLGAEILRHSATIANRSRDYPEATALASRGLAWTPLDWQLYFVRALAEANQRKTQSALDDFRRARFLEPNAFEVPYDEGSVWLTLQPSLALTAWREALRRAGPQRAEIYGKMLTLAQQFNPRVVASLHALAQTDRDLVIAYLDRLRGDDFNKAIDELLERDPDLAALQPNQLAQVVQLWSERGDLVKLSAAVERHPGWLPSASGGLAKWRAQQHDYEGATQLALRFGVRPVLPQPTGSADAAQLANIVASNPTNYAAGFTLYRLQREQGKLDDALNTIRHFTETTHAPAYFHYVEADCWAEKKEWERAWAAYEKFEAAVRK